MTSLGDAADVTFHFWHDRQDIGREPQNADAAVVGDPTDTVIMGEDTTTAMGPTWGAWIT